MVKIQDSVNEDKIKGEIENARAAYQVAAHLWSSRANELWSQFNSILTANSIVLAVGTIAITSPQSSPVLKIGIPLAGFLLCLLWFALHARGSGYTIYWPLSAREIEEKYFNDDVKVFSRGGRFSAGHPVNITIDGQKKTVRMNLIGRLIKVEWVAYLVITIFAVIYIALLTWIMLELSA